MRWDSFIFNGCIVLLAHGPLTTERFCELISEESEGQVAVHEALSMLGTYWCKDYFRMVFTPAPRWMLECDYWEGLISAADGLVAAVEITLRTKQGTGIPK